MQQALQFVHGLAVRPVSTTRRSAESAPSADAVCRQDRGGWLSFSLDLITRRHGEWRGVGADEWCGVRSPHSVATAQGNGMTGLPGNYPFACHFAAGLPTVRASGKVCLWQPGHKRPGYNHLHAVAVCPACICWLHHHGKSKPSLGTSRCRSDTAIRRRACLPKAMTPCCAVTLAHHPPPSWAVRDDNGSWRWPCLMCRRSRCTEALRGGVHTRTHACIHCRV